MLLLKRGLITRDPTLRTKEYAQPGSAIHFRRERDGDGLVCSKLLTKVNLREVLRQIGEIQESNSWRNV